MTSSEIPKPRGSQALSYRGDDELLHLWECPHLLKPDEFHRCGYIATGPGACSYDHGEDVLLVPITALVLCSDCREPIHRDDSRAPDGRLICGHCILTYLGDWPTASCCGEPRVAREVDACYDHAAVCPQCREEPSVRGSICPRCAT